MRRMTVAAALAAALAAGLAVGTFLGCNKPPEQGQAPGPASGTSARPTGGRSTADDDLTRSGPPSTGTPGGTYSGTSITTGAVPPPPPPQPTSQPSGATRKYVVKAHDGLMAIARTELGNASRWKEIPPLNPGMDPSAGLKVGQEILIPAK